ncbi:MAG: hypothetical protein U1F30_02325 [Steroidobacteraceae bacterium]
MTRERIMKPATVRQLEREWAEAAAAAIRAERAWHDIVAAGEDGDALTAAAWLALWRAEERQRALDQELEAARMLLQDAAA